MDHQDFPRIDSDWFVGIYTYGMVNSLNTPRKSAGRQQNRANPDVQTVSDYYKVTLYTVFLDYLVQEMETRTLGNEERYCAQHLLPSKRTDLRNNMLPTIYAPFAPDLPPTYETFK